jgi:hypothetical protein
MTPTSHRITRTMMITPTIPTPPPYLISISYRQPDRVVRPVVPGRLRKS